MVPWIGVVLGSSALAHAECSKDIECEGERVCEAGHCVAESPSALPQATQTAPPRARFFDDEAPTRKPGKRIGNPALMTAGIVVAASGPALWITGALTTSCDRTVDTECNAGPRLLAFFAGGLALIGAGVPMIVIGAKRVPAGRVTAAPWFAPRRGGGLQLQLEL